MKSFVYIFRRPCGTPFYVGMTSRDSRLRSWRRNDLCNAIITKLRSQGLQPYREIIECASSEEALKLEEQLIEKYGRLDQGSGSLSNHTNGGEFGVSGYSHSEEFRQRQSIAMLGNKNPIGHKHSEETKLKMSLAASAPKIGNTHALGNKNVLGYRHTQEKIKQIVETRKRNAELRKAGIHVPNRKERHALKRQQKLQQAES